MNEIELLTWQTEK